MGVEGGGVGVAVGIGVGVTEGTNGVEEVGEVDDNEEDEEAVTDVECEELGKEAGPNGSESVGKGMPGIGNLVNGGRTCDNTPPSNCLSERGCTSNASIKRA